MYIPHEPEGHRRTSAGTELFYHDIGQGPVLLFLHGGGLGAAGWGNFFPVVDELSDQFRLIILDLPGYGRSERLPAEGNGYEEKAKLIAQFIEDLNLGLVHLVGMATGGAVAAAISVLFPHLVRDLILVSSAGGHSLFSVMPSEGQKSMRSYNSGRGPSRDKMRQYLELVIHDTSKVTDELVDSRYQASLKQPAEEHHTGGLVADRPLWTQLNKITSRTLIVWGTENRFQGFDNALFMTDQIVNSQLHLFSNTGLWIPYERREEFPKLIKSFLR